MVRTRRSAKLQHLDSDDEDNVLMEPLDNIDEYEELSSQEMSYSQEDLLEKQILKLSKEQALTFFGTLVPQDIFFSVMSFVPAFPNLFRMRRVSKSWQAFIEYKVYDLVEELDLLDHADTPAECRSIDLATLKFLTQVMPNVTRLVVPCNILASESNSVLGRYFCPKDSANILKKWKRLQQLHLYADNTCFNELDMARIPQVSKLCLYGFDESAEIKNHHLITSRNSWYGTNKEKTHSQYHLQNVASFTQFCKNAYGMIGVC